MTTCVVIMSGGQDSTTCLAYALKKYGDVHAIAFDYSQKHKIELEKAASICKDWTVPLERIDVSFLNSLGNSSLTGNGDGVFVCNRNAMFLTIAHGVAQNEDARVVIGGMCQGDFSGFTDCREEFIKSLENSLNLGYASNISFEMPLMHKSKAETFKLAEELGILDKIIEDTHTCYNGDSSTKHAWGFGCGQCGSCKVRRKGWESFIQQKLLEMNKV